MQKISVGVDGITTTIRGNIVDVETKLPSEEHYFLVLTPKGNNTEISVILPKTIRISNTVGFRSADIKMLCDSIQEVTRQLKKYQRDMTDCYVRQLEVACTVDLGNVDDTTVNSLLQLFSTVLLVNEKKTGDHNKVACSPQQVFMTSQQLKEQYYFLKKKVIKSFITSTWSNRRLKWKCYSKGAGSEFGGDTTIFRLEAVYNETGIKYILNQDTDRTITLADILTERVIKACIASFKTDYREIVSSRLKGYLNESEAFVLDKLESMSAYNALLVSLPYIPDINVYRRALEKHYKKQGKSEGAFRKMYASVLKKLRDQEQTEVSDKVVTILQLIGKHTKR